MNSPAILLLSLFIWINNIAQSQQSPTATIRVKAKKFTQVVIHKDENLIYSKLKDTTLLADGELDLQIEMKKPCLVSCKVGKKYSYVFLTPKSFVTISDLDSLNTAPLLLGGTNAGISNFLNVFDTRKEEFRGIGLKNEMFKLNPNELVKGIGNLKEYGVQIIQANSMMDDLQKKFAMRSLDVSLQCIIQEYFFIIDSRGLLNKYEEDTNFRSSISQLWEIANDSSHFDEFMNLGLYEENLFNFYWLNNRIINKYDGKNMTDSMQFTLPSDCDKKIRMLGYSKEVTEYLLARSILMWLDYQGLTPMLENMILKYKSEFAQSSYLPAIENEYKKLKRLVKGKTAPEILATDIKGNEFSLSNLKGKLIYIDVWATWCGPCIEEIAHSKKLYSELHSRYGLEFVFLTMDTKEKLWKKMVLNDKNWNGIHISMPAEKHDEFSTAYSINGLPSYILIDKEGKIVTIDAPRPSEPEKLKKLLDTL